MPKNKGGEQEGRFSSQQPYPRQKRDQMMKINAKIGYMKAEIGFILKADFETKHQTETGVDLHSSIRHLPLSCGHEIHTRKMHFL